MIPTRLILLSSTDAPWPWLTVSDDGAVLQRGMLPPNAAPPENPVIDRLVAPGVEVVVRWLDLPDRNDLQARAAVSFLLQDDIAREGEDLHVAVGRADDGGRRLAAITDLGAVRGWLAQAAARGVAPVSITPDHLMLRPRADDEIVVAGFGGLISVRGPGLAFAGEPALVDAVLGERPRRTLSLPELEGMLAASALDPEINLLQGPLGEKPERQPIGQLRSIALLGLLLILSPLILAGAQIGKDLLAAHDLQSRAAERARIAWPSTARSDDPVAAVRARVAAQAAADRFAGLAADLFAAVEAIPGAQLDSLGYSEQGVMRARLSYVNHSDIDQLVQAGRRLGLRILPESTVTEGARITADINITRQP